MSAGELALSVKNPLAILAEDAERGIVVKAGRIVELVPTGHSPDTPGVQAFEAGNTSSCRASSTPIIISTRR